jgi:hypothetical protein
MAVIHIPEEEASKDLSALLKKVALGDEVVIDGAATSARLIQEKIPRGRTVAQMRAILESLPGERGYMDEDFARDVLNFRKRHPESLDGSKWD